LSGIVLVRQPMQAPTRAIGEIEQHLTGSSLQLLSDALSPLSDALRTKEHLKMLKKRKNRNRVPKIR
jgi:hypothetical protein